MTNRIPQSFLDELLFRTDIVELIDSSVPLKKTGGNYSACCPFHQEKTPSFTVSQAKQFYHCFGCGASGNAISFLMNHDGLNFREAVQTLAELAGLELPTGTQNNAAPDTTPLYNLLSSAAQFYQTELKKNQHAIQYLKARGLSGETAKHYGLGFAPDGWDNLTKALPSASKSDFLKTGLKIQNDQQKIYDRFRNRIMFPIRDRRGRVIGFGGRVLDDSTPKYLNSPETVIFHKGQSLYGLYEARQYQRDLTQILIVEGYMDVLALAEKGIHYSVATLGTATTEQHIKQLLRHTKRLTFCFDGDNAGRKAAWRALEISLTLMEDGAEIHFMFLEQGEDPDSYVKQHGKAAFETKIQNASTLSQFFFEHHMQDINISTADGRAKLHQTAMKTLSTLKDSYFKRSLLQELSNISRLQVDMPTQKSSQHYPRERQSLKMPSPVRTLLALLLHDPKLVKFCPDTLSELQLPGIAFLADFIALLKQHKDLSLGAILEHWRDTPFEGELMKLAGNPLFIPESGLEQECQDTVTRLKALSIEKEIEGLMAKAASPAGLSITEKQLLQRLLKNKNTEKLT